MPNDRADLEARLGKIVVGYDKAKKAVTARDLKADGAMTVLLEKAIQPNLVQTLENNPAFIHGGPFANIAHGCNSVIATKTALKLADYVVTEAGFGADLGAEKFFDIKCRAAGLKPAAAVIVATIRALKMNGGVKKDELGKENVEALTKGCANLGRHIENVKSFGVPVIVAINRFITDSEAEIAAIKTYAQVAGRRSRALRALGQGLGRHRGAGAQGRRHDRRARRPSSRRSIRTRCRCSTRSTPSPRSIYRADKATADKKILDQLKAWEDAGFGHFPVCMAKTQYSFTTNPDLRGAPTGHEVPIREVRLSAGAGFVVAIAGDIMTMPGLPKAPSAEIIRFNQKGEIEGLF